MDNESNGLPAPSVAIWLGALIEANNRAARALADAAMILDGMDRAVGGRSDEP